MHRILFVSADRRPTARTTTSLSHAAIRQKKTTIASFTPLLSWLKGAPPGINPSSRQQKKNNKRELPIKDKTFWWLSEPRARTAWAPKNARENKEQRGKRKFHEGNDRSFTQWLGRAAWSTRYMCGFQQAGPQWLQSGCLVCRPIQASLLILSMDSLLQGFPRNRPECILGTNLGKRLLVPVEQCQTWIALKWSTKSDNGHCQVQQSSRCSMLAAECSGLSWMTKLFWTAILCYRKASFVMFSCRSVQLHGRALQVKGLRSPLCCRAVKMQMTGLTYLWPTFTTRGTLTEEISEKTFRKERRRLQAKHLWMEVKLSWHVLADRMYTAAPTGNSREQLYALLFNKAARGSQKNPYEEKAYRGPAYKAVQAWWEQCQEWMLYYKGQSAPLVQNLQGLLQAFRDKEGDARAEVEAYMEYCAKRWQTREGTYQLKRRRLLPDVRDQPEQGNAEVDMKDIWTLHGWHGGLLHGGRDDMRGWEGRDLFHLYFANFHWPLWCWVVLCFVVCLGCFGFC